MFSIREELDRIPATGRALRDFGLLFCAVFWIAAAVIWKKTGAPDWRWWAAAGALMLGLGLLRPGWLRAPFRVWMGFAVVLNFIVLRVLFTLFFFLVVTPIALVLRALGKRPIDDSAFRGDGGGSYWTAVDRVPDKDSYNHQF